MLVVLTVGATLIYGTFDMPRFADPAAPVHSHVAPLYINDSPKEIGIPNMVTSVLASYRGYDTFGEVTVIFTAGIGVLLLLSSLKARSEASDPDPGMQRNQSAQANVGRRQEFLVRGHVSVQATPHLRVLRRPPQRLLQGQVLLPWLHLRRRAARRRLQW